ncbi:MAG TPA: hypothetical protein VF782_11620 [Allosphingosinicella sp.]|jgi:hypothetical protein
MRHQDLRSDTHNVAAVWPDVRSAAAASAAVSPAAVVPQPAAAMPDLPVGAARLVVCAYAGLMGVLFAFFAGSPLATFCLAICAFFVATFFGVARTFLAVEADPAVKPSMDRFMRDGIDTLTGRCGGRDALVQMLVVPVLLMLGLGAMGVAGMIYLG